MVAQAFRLIRRSPWVITTLICFLTIAGSYAITTANRQAALAETCKFIDADHDAKRADLVTDLSRIFRPPYRVQFPLSPRAAHKAYRDSKNRYDHIIDTRPKYCKPRAPIKPFPPYSKIDPGPPQSKP